MIQTLKKGSRGSDVKKLQELLHMSNCDGVFGPATELALKQWQSTHKDTSGKPLASDGICGQKTWDALIASSAVTHTNPSVAINHQHASAICTRKSNRSIKYIVIHYTAGASSVAGKALATRRDWLNRPKDKQASADFVVDDKEIVQINPDITNYFCWSVGGDIYKGYGGASLFRIATNSNVISIEMCSTLAKGTSAAAPNHDGWSVTQAVLDNTVKLVRYLMKEYNIPIDRVIRHYDVNGKACPGMIGWNDAPIFDAKTGTKTTQKNNSQKWLDFKRRLM